MPDLREITIGDAPGDVVAITRDRADMRMDIMWTGTEGRVYWNPRNVPYNRTATAYHRDGSTSTVRLVEKENEG